MFNMQYASILLWSLVFGNSLCKACSRDVFNPLYAANFLPG